MWSWELDDLISGPIEESEGTGIEQPGKHSRMVYILQLSTAQP